MLFIFRYYADFTILSGDVAKILCNKWTRYPQRLRQSGILVVLAVRSCYRYIYYNDFCELCGKGQCLMLRRPGDHLHFIASFYVLYLLTGDRQERS